MTNIATLQVSRISALGNSCNFCDRLIHDRNAYTHVTTMRRGLNGSLEARICDFCVEELVPKMFINKLS